MEGFLYKIKKLIPQSIFTTLQPLYHYTIAHISALLYGFPSKEIFIVGITGTKGKSTTAEIINAVLEEAGHKTALAGTIRFKIGNSSERNRYKMTMPGRFFMQRFLRKAVREGCTYAVIEMTSEGVKQFRHLFIHLDALVFTNITPEHIEAHGSFDKYLKAKFRLVRLLEESSKRPRVVIANADDKYGQTFLGATVEESLPYSLANAKYKLTKDGIALTFNETEISSKLVGTFNVYNICAALTFAQSQNIHMASAKHAIEKLESIPGRAERITLGQNFDVIVDYAHTPESLESVYQAFENKRKICVLGNTGGGRDTWKRPKMGTIAEKYCDKVILTNEDPYDESPMAIVDAMARGMKKKPEIIMDRRAAIRHALSMAKKGDAVLITGKGTDPYIMGPNGSHTPWSDSRVAQDELEELLGRNK
jgi:UDP-N-acetylmuramoyl-L-alanyl-D-glutamate--2,6-diaminopimelate ligase|tara:strand:- start:20386 stop:21651 length:1266 start_codon:yes stop_codon:yes gene_type:complete